MRIERRDRNTYELIDGNETGALTYNGWLSRKACATVNDIDCEIKPDGIFSTSMSVTKNGQHIATIKRNWKIQVLISFYDGQVFKLKHAGGFFSRKYALEDSNGRELLQLDPKPGWWGFSNYTLSYEDKPGDILLVLLAIYSVNYAIVSSSA